MTTIPGISTTGLYGYGVQPAAGPAGKQSNAAGASPAASPAQDGVLATLGSGTSSPLTYSAAGVFASPAAQGATTSRQAAQNAVIAAENAVTDTLASLASNSSSRQSSSALDIPALLGSSGASGPGTQAAGGSVPQTAQDTFAAVQNVITSTLGSLGAGSSSGSGA